MGEGDKLGRNEGHEVRAGASFFEEEREDFSEQGNAGLLECSEDKSGECERLGRCLQLSE